eukprot:2222206-Alexandrium_andersonii.AAC.1
MVWDEPQHGGCFMKPLHQGLPVRGVATTAMAAGRDARAPGLPRTRALAEQCAAARIIGALCNKAQSQRYPLTGFNSGRCAPTAGPRAEARLGRI